MPIPANSSIHTTFHMYVCMYLSMAKHNTCGSLQIKSWQAVTSRKLVLLGMSLGYRSEQVRLLAENKDMIGVRYLDEAIDLAEEEGLDVVLVSPDADPPVCRLMDASKHKYELEKRDKEAKKKQRESR